MGARPTQRPDIPEHPAVLQAPLTVTVDEVACMLNFELADHPVYDGGELQWFDDDVHGTGMLVFLSRRADRRVDYYAQRGLALDRAGYHLAGGTGSWTVVDFEVARLDVADDGVDAEVVFRDVDGRLIEVRVVDRDGRPRRRGGLLAPVGAGIERPTSLLLVWMPAFDLVRHTRVAPTIRIDGRDAATGRLPGARLHRRHLIKYAAPVVVVGVNRTDDAPVPLADGGSREPADAPAAVSQVTAEEAGHQARLVLDPALPAVTALVDGAASAGRWHVDVDGVRLTGGSWSAARTGDRVALGMDVDERWQPGRLPWLMRLVTTVVPVFRRWPTTYRWRADVQLDDTPAVTARWERTRTDTARSYRRATGTQRQATAALAEAAQTRAGGGGGGLCHSRRLWSALTVSDVPGRFVEAAGCPGRGGGSAMSVNKTRGMLYLLARLLGDVQAVRRGRVGNRVARRVAGKATGRTLGRFFR